MAIARAAPAARRTEPGLQADWRLSSQSGFPLCRGRRPPGSNARGRPRQHSI